MTSAEVVAYWDAMYRIFAFVFMLGIALAIDWWIHR